VKKEVAIETQRAKMYALMGATDLSWRKRQSAPGVAHRELNRPIFRGQPLYSLRTAFIQPSCRLDRGLMPSIRGVGSREPQTPDLICIYICRRRGDKCQRGCRGRRGGVGGGRRRCGGRGHSGTRGQQRCLNSALIAP
jgi:hypothetical protein